MKVPRGLAADQLIKTLQRLGYEVVRQKGSHVRLRHPGPPEHSITVPQHRPLKTGTLHALLREIAHQRSLNLEELIEML
jgi:hypothetical protein